MEDDGPDILDPTPPVQLAWANLDAFVSAAFVAALSGDPVEIGITLGRLETKAKLEKLKKIFRHRGNLAIVETLTEVGKEVEALRELRNAITHGFYLGYSRQAEFAWSILPEFVLNPGDAGTQLFLTTPREMIEHTQRVIALSEKVAGCFGEKELRRLFELPSHVRP
jgi:hypothetical protein